MPAARFGLAPRPSTRPSALAAPRRRSRNKLLADFDFAGLLEELTWIDDFHAQRQGKNGGGDPYHTDGRLPVVVIAVRAESPRSGE